MTLVVVPGMGIRRRCIQIRNAERLDKIPDDLSARVDGQCLQRGFRRNAVHPQRQKASG